MLFFRAISALLLGASEDMYYLWFLCPIFNLQGWFVSYKCTWSELERNGETYYNFGIKHINKMYAKKMPLIFD